MAVFRVEKRTGYTVMSNYHLRDKNLSCKAWRQSARMVRMPFVLPCLNWNSMGI